jgi:tetrahydrodipicolinate N-succinyltransferase
MLAAIASSRDKCNLLIMGEQCRTVRRYPKQSVLVAGKVKRLEPQRTLRTSAKIAEKTAMMGSAVSADFLRVLCG